MVKIGDWKDWVNPLIVVLVTWIIAKIAWFFNSGRYGLFISIMTLYFIIIGSILFVTTSSNVKPKLKFSGKLDFISHCAHITRLTLENHSRFSAKVYVDLNLKVDGNPESMGNLFTGKKAWHLSPNEAVEGHFDLNEEIINLLEKKKNSRNKNNLLRVEVEVWNAGISQFFRKYSVKKWYFDFDEGKWEKGDLG
jgi:hypothetical protein